MLHIFYNILFKFIYSRILYSLETAKPLQCITVFIESWYADEWVVRVDSSETLSYEVEEIWAQNNFFFKDNHVILEAVHDMDIPELTWFWKQYMTWIYQSRVDMILEAVHDMDIPV